MPMIIKSVHVCHSGHLVKERNHAGSTWEHPSQNHNAETCFVCHFTFSHFNTSKATTLGVILAISFFMTPVVYRKRLLRPTISVASLRAPPYHI
ncbi:MAG: hypothetical protein PUH24_04645 [Prevotellaceae bacterium]|nr:hypothetical protein [Prevotella sp.]MDD7257552.1 hypothetical protein [Prevotellaceae bacterium]MDY6130660.1 hypothetical protein [Prevotella sp.]